MVQVRENEAGGSRGGKIGLGDWWDRVGKKKV